MADRKALTEITRIQMDQGPLPTKTHHPRSARHRLRKRALSFPVAQDNQLLMDICLKFVQEFQSLINICFSHRRSVPLVRKTHSERITLTLGRQSILGRASILLSALLISDDFQDFIKKPAYLVLLGCGVRPNSSRLCSTQSRTCRLDPWRTSSNGIPASVRDDG